VTCVSVVDPAKEEQIEFAFFFFFPPTPPAPTNPRPRAVVGLRANSHFEIIQSQRRDGWDPTVKRNVINKAHLNEKSIYKAIGSFGCQQGARGG
jgi:hypothetical protein